MRFRRPFDVTGVIARGVRAALEEHGIRRPVAVSRPVPAPPIPGPPPALPLAERLPPLRPGPSIPAHPDDVPGLAAVAAEPIGPPPLPTATPTVDPAPAPSLPDALLPVPRFRDLRVIGQLARTYVLCEGAGELVLVDQHAAHERVTLHRLRRDRADRLGTAQQLLAPVEVELPLPKAEALADQLEVLTELRIVAARVAPDRIAVQAVPTLLERVDIVALVRDLADEVSGEGARAGEALVDNLLATMACHSSVRAADPLSTWEMRALLAALDEVDFGVCAHGRPVAIRIGPQELERRFHRS